MRNNKIEAIDLHFRRHKDEHTHPHYPAIHLLFEKSKKKKHIAFEYLAFYRTTIKYAQWKKRIASLAYTLLAPQGKSRTRKKKIKSDTLYPYMYTIIHIYTFTVIFPIFQFILVLDYYPFAYIKHIAH